VRYVSLGPTSSKDEFSEIVKKAHDSALAENQVRGFADLLTLIARTETGGFNQERKRWTRSEHTSVFTFAGPGDEHDLNAIWAAVRVQSDNRTIVLLKLIADYSPGSHQGHLDDALDRDRRGSHYD
jgi:hypothetical protein